MAKGGYIGKILYVNLTDKTTEIIPTADYEQWGGGHGVTAGIGSCPGGSFHQGPLMDVSGSACG